MADDQKPEENPYLKMMQENAPPRATTTPQATPAEPSTMQKIGQVAGDVATGIGKGALHTISGTDEFARKHLPAFLTNSNFGFGPPANLEHVKQMATPTNTAQKIGHGIEQAGEFLIPGAGEEKLASLAPKVMQPIARIATSALGSGLVNKAQGGNFTTGALAGAGGQAVGQGIKAIAPKLAEASVGIGKADRAFAKTPGKAILEETRGIRPSTVAESGQEKLNQLTPELEQKVERASIRPNPVRGLLPAPPREIPLSPTPAPRNPAMRPMAFRAEVNPEEPFAPRSGNPMAPISEYPSANPHYLSGSAHPELSGRVPTTQGVLIRPQNAPIGASLPSVLPNESASLSGARGIVGNAMGKASRENAASLHGQLGEMQNFLGRRFDTGEAIPSSVTPRDLLDLKRGFSKEFLGRWNPETHGDTISAGRGAYHALDSELDRTVPEAQELNQRISSLIPVVHRAESTSRNAPVAQMLMKKIGAPTGALVGGAFGAGEGYQHGGVPGAVAGGLTGLIAPSLVSTPEGWMLMARGANKANGLRPAVGALMQPLRDKTEGQQ